MPMPHHDTRRVSLLILSAIAGASLIACGGGGGTAVAPVTSLAGVAATGAAMANATITITDANGVTATKTAGSDGAYSVDISSLEAPLVITATLDVGGTRFTLTSMVAEKPTAGTTGTANVTPMTNAIAALLAPNGNPEELLAPAVMKASVSKTKVKQVQDKLLAAIENVLKDAGLDPATFDFVTTAFTANRKGADRMLEMVRVELTGAGVSLTNSLALDDGNGSASVQLGKDGTSSGKLAAPPAGAELGTLDHIATLFETCFADPAAVRVTARDSNDVPTALSAACAALPFAANYLGGGYTAMQNYGMLKNDDYTGAKFRKPEILFTAANGDVRYRMPFQTTGGLGSISSDVAKKTSPPGKPYTWEIMGNQLAYDSGVSVRLENNNQLNPNYDAQGDKSRFTVALSLNFNPISPGGKTVQAVRVKGPGLPAAGVSMHRSALCRTEDYMTISSKTGVMGSSTFAYLYNQSGSNVFRLATELKAGTFDWSKVTANSSWRDAPMTDAELAAIPSFAEYTWEVWLLGAPLTYRNFTASTPPDVVYKQVMLSRVPALSSLKTMTWNTIDATEFLNPVGSLAGVQASTTVAWKSLAEPVDLAFAFGRKNTAAAGQTPSSFVSADAADPVKITASSKVLTPATGISGTASLQGILGGVTVVIPNCATAQFPAFDNVMGTKLAINGGTDYYGTYRSQTVRSRTYGLSRKYVTNSWGNFID
jgi:hypothetical protein